MGNTVLLKNITEAPRRKKAEVASIMKRRQWVTISTVRKPYGGFEIMPDIAIRYNLPIPKNDLMGVRPSDKVQAELVWVPRRERLSARMVRICGTAESAKICTDTITNQNGIPTVFPEAVMAEATRAAQEPITQEEFATRLDLHEGVICTIDGAGAKNLDNAISMRRTEHGFDLDVHVADASHYVREGSAADEEAFLRGTSVYFADRVTLTLPKELSDGACSLNAGGDEFTFSALVHLDGKGEVVNYRFQKTMIHSRVHGVYSEVDHIFSDEAGEALLERYAPVLGSLKTDRELVKILEQHSHDKGAVDFENGESVFALDENGVCIDVRPRAQEEARKMIEQLIIAVNQAAAKFAKEEQLPFVYRIHENPDPERIKVLISLAATLSFSTQRLHFEKPSPADFSELLGQVRGTPVEQVISYQVLRMTEKAKYSTEPIGHFDLTLADYRHFTSPIRRYPDLTIHRIPSQSQSLG